MLARTVVIATGARYRKPALDALARFEGVGVYYCATALEARLCGGEEVIVVGGANSAGQAAVFLARTARKVHMLVRGKALSDTMSRYLIRRIEETPNDRAARRDRDRRARGRRRRSSASPGWNKRTGERATHAIRHVFMMTGASPNTEWLGGCVALDGKGFVKAGAGPDAPGPGRRGLAAARAPPYLFETSRPGVFAVGDVRANSVKRVASAVGEGSICIQLVHKVLAE